MHPMILFTLLPTLDGSKRDKLLGLMDGVSKNAYANEPGVLQFSLLIPKTTSNDTSMYSFEAYADMAAFSSHLGTQPVKDMFSWINSENIYATPPSVHNISIFQDTGFHFVKPALKTTPNPYILVTEATFKEGLAPQSAPSWKELVSVSQTENGSLAFGVYTESEKPNKIFTFEAYESEKYLTDVHSKTSAYTENDKALKNSTTALVRTLLQAKGGFLYKEGAFS